MAEERIDSYLDLAALKKETDAALSLMEMLMKAKDNLSKSKSELQLATNAKEIAKALSAVPAALENVDKAADNVRKQSDNLEKSQKNAAKATKETTTETEKLVGAYDRLKQQFALADKEAKNLAAEFGVNSEQAIKAAESAAAFNAQLKEIDDLQKTSGGSKTVNVTTSTNTVDNSGLTEATRNAAKAEDEHTQSILANEKAQQAKLQTEQQVIRTISEEEKAEQQALKTKKDKANAERAEEAAKREKVRLDNEVIRQISLEEKAEQDILKTQKLRLAEAERANRITASEAKAISDASNEYLQLGKALRDAELKYKNLALTQGFQHEQTQAALKDALAIRGVLDKVDESLGNYQRKVGQYGTAFNGLGMSIQQILREAPSAAVSLNTFFLAISNNLPMFFDEITKIKEEQKAANIATKEAAILAREQAVATALNAGATKEAAIAEGALAEKTVIANAAATSAPGIMKRIIDSLFSLQTGLTLAVLLLTMFGSQVIAAVGSMVRGRKSMLDLTKAQEDLNEELKNTSKEYNEVVVKLEILNDRVAQAGKSFAEKQEILKDYNKEFGDTLGVAKDYNDVERILREKTGDYIQAMLLRAKAQAALNLAIKEQEKIFQENQDAEQFRRNTERGLKDRLSLYDDNYKKIVQKEVDLSLRQREELKKRNEQEAGDRKKYFEQQFNDLQLQADALDRVKKMDSDSTDNNKAKREKHYKTMSDIIKELRKELATIGNEEAIGQLSPKEGDIDRVKAYEKAFKDLFDIGKTSKTPIVKVLTIELQPINQRVIEAQIHDLVSKIKTDPIEVAPPVIDNKAQRDLIIKNTSEQIQKISDLNDEGYVHDLENLKSYLDAEVITREEYNKRLEALKTEHARSELDNSVALTEAIISNLKARSDGTKEATDQIAEYERKLNELKAKLYEEDGKNSDKSTKKRKKDAEELLKEAQDLRKKLLSDLQNDAFNLIDTLVKASIEGQIRAVEALDEAQQKNYDKQVQRINDSSLTEEQKTERLKVLEAQRAAQKDQNEAKERELNIKRARFERLENVARIAAATASAEVQALTYLASPLTAPLYPGIAALIAATGAIQLAAVLATPLPKYKDGTQNHKGGAFIWGEAGTELAIEPSGKMYFSPDKETLGVAPAGTKIIPNYDLHKVINNIEGQTINNYPAAPLSAKKATEERKQSIVELKIKASIDVNDRIVDNIKLPIETRLNALNKSFESSKSLIEKETDYESKLNELKISSTAKVMEITLQDIKLEKEIHKGEKDALRSIKNIELSILKVIHSLINSSSNSIGVTEVKTLLSTIPQFRTGKFTDYEGLSFVGDGNKKEVILRENGDIELTPDKPTLTWVGKKDVVYPDIKSYTSTITTKQTDRIITNSTVKVDPNKELIFAYRQSATTIANAIKKMPQPKINFYNNGEFNEWVRINVRGKR